MKRILIAWLQTGLWIMILELTLPLENLFEYNSSISSLKNSKMSNHIGINGFLITSDNKLIFVKRSGSVSFGKNILGCSLAASIKTKYALNIMVNLMYQV